jgi:hypothetical protein
LTEAQILEIDAAGDVTNCSITEYGLHAGAGSAIPLTLIRYNFIDHLHEAGAPVTAEPDKEAVAR